MIAGTLVLPETIVGMIEQSTTHSPSMPRTRSRGSTTASSSTPMRHVSGRMKDRGAMFAREPKHVVVIDEIVAGLHLGRDIVRERRLLRQFPRELDCCNGTASVDLRIEIVGVNARRQARVARGELDAAAAFGTKLTDRHREPGKVVHLPPRHVGAQRADMKLDVGCLRLRQRARVKQAALIDADGERPPTGAAATASPFVRGPPSVRSRSLVVIGRLQR